MPPDLALMGWPEENESIMLQNISQGEYQGVVALMVQRGMFIKLRVTHIKDDFLVEIAEDFLSSFQSLKFL